MKSALSVLMTTDTVGGVWNYSLELSRAMASDGCRVHLFAMGLELTSLQREEARRVCGVTLHGFPCRLEWMEDPWRDVEHSGRALLELERRVKPDVIHLNGYSHAALKWNAPSLVVGHSCVLSWWEAVKNDEPPQSLGAYRKKVESGLKSAGMVVCPSRSMLDSLSRHYGFSGPGKVVPNGRNPAFFQPGQKEEIILTAGRFWDEAKNIAALGDLAPELPWPVYAAGSGLPKGRPVGSIRMLGMLPQAVLANWFSWASIFALPAYYEPFGLSVLEAALSGCALVLGDIESLRETWDGAAVFVNPGDAESLRAGIMRLIEDPSERERLGALARERALRYTPARMAHGYIQTYRHLIESWPGWKEERACV